MSKILILNGSPRKGTSSTMVVAKAFAKGLSLDHPEDIEVVNIADLNIKPCLGCLSCWAKTEGKCVIKNDDIASVMKKIEEADYIIEAFGLYFFGMPGIMKVFTDRMMPFMCTYRGQKAPEDGESFHGIRSLKKENKLIVISSCAYSDATVVFDSLITQYDYICGHNSYYPILCPQLKTLVDLHNEAKTNRFLTKFYEAGKSLRENKTLSNEEIMNLRKPPFSEGAYKIFLDKHWEEEKQGN